MIITLLTDFGFQDEYVGVMKGVILSILPSARIVDLSHQIDPQNMDAAAFMIHAAYPFFPKGSVHVVVVDPGVGSGRSMIAVFCHGHYFIAPDNGVLTLIVKSREFQKAFQITNSALFLPDISRTFHGRDIFAPVAAHIASGVTIEKLGPPVQPENLIYLHAIYPETLRDGSLKGRIVTSDRFGNLITNISKAHLMNQFPKPSWHHLNIAAGSVRIHGISDHYGHLAIGLPLAVIGSRGYLEIAVNCGSAADFLQFKKGRSSFSVQCRLSDTDFI